uniref:Uncharacterized protein n=1 Tax=Anguilla anguilla TaxID=7936 RepID=A0A0E9UCP4_ANGAN
MLVEDHSHGCVHSSVHIF